MAVGKQDISLLFGVLGDGKISGESGVLIKSQLASIVKSLNSKAEVKSRGIAVTINTQGTKKNFKDGIQNVLQGLDGNKQFKLKITEVDAKPALKSLKAQMQEMLNSLKIDNVKAAFDNTTSASNTPAGGSNETNKVKKDLSEINAKLKEINTTNSKITSQYRTISASLSASTDSANINAAESLRQKYIQLEAATISLKNNRENATDAEVENIYRLQTEIRELLGLYTAASNEAKTASSLQSKLASVQRAAQTALGYTKARYTSQYKEIEEINKVINEMLIGLREVDSVTLDRLNATIKRNTASIKSMGMAGKSLFDYLDKGAKKFVGWFSISQVVMRAVHSLRYMLNVVIDIDTAMTELKKVTDETNIAYSRFLDRAADRAAKLGATLSDTVRATADFARLGYTLEEATSLSDAALVYKNVGDGIDDISTASESVISTMKAFGIEAENAMDIVNIFNEIGNNFAITSKGVGDALVRSASALASANNSFEESVALITGANSVVQDADKVGTTLKTISMFLRAAKTEAEEAGESTEGMADSVSELRSEILALTGGKVDMMIDSDTFKSTTQILREISAVWDEITDVSQANLLEMLGGKRNANVVASLITNFDIVEKALISTSEAANSAVEENEKYLNSISGKVTLFKTEVEALSVNLIDSELSKFFIDAATGVVKIANGLAEINALLPVTLSLVTAITTTKSIGKVSSVFDTFGKVLTVDSGKIRIHANNIDALKSGYDGLAISQKSALKLMIKSSLEANGLSDKYDDVVRALGLVKVSSDSATASNTALTASFNSLKTALLTNPFFWVTIVATALPIIIDLFGELYDTNEELIESAKELTTAYNDAAAEITNNLKTLRGLEDEFNRLSKGVGEYGENISLSTTDYERYQEIVQTIIGISPSLIEGYDAEGNAIANKNGLLEESIRLMEEEQLLRAKERTTSENNKTVGMGVVGELREHAKSDPRTNIYDHELYDYFNELQGFGLDRREFRYALAPDGGENNQNITSDFITKYYDQIVDSLENGKEQLIEAKTLTSDEIDKLLDLLYQYGDDIRSFDLETGRISKGYADQLQVAAQATGVYNKLSDAQKAFLTAHIDTKKVTENMSGDDFDAMVAEIEDLTKLIAETPKLQGTINLGMRLKTGTNEDGESLSMREYSAQFDALMEDIESYDGDVRVVIETALDVSATKEQIDGAKERVKNLLSDDISNAEIDDFIGSMTYEQIKLVYKVTEDPNSLTIDELKQKIIELSIDWEKTVDVWDVTSMVEGISNIESAISGLTSAMDKLNSGTALTKEELAKLALQYPELLKVQNLFTDSTISGQKAILDSTLGSYESEYDALVDAKIAELEVAKQTIEGQIELEGQKRAIVESIHAMSMNDKLENEEDYQLLLNELHDLENKNLTEASDTNLDINESMLNMMLKQAGDGVKKSEDIWGAQGQLIADAHASGLTKAGQVIGQYFTKLKTYLSTNPVVKGVIGKLGGILGFSISDTDSGNDNAGSVGPVISGLVDLDSGIDDDITISGQSVEEFTANYEEIIQKRLDALEQAKLDTQAMIDNLKSMKGLDLASIYGSDSTGSGSKVDEYIADIDKYREAMERLSRVQIKKGNLSTELSNTDDLHAQIELHRQLIDVYKDEQDAQRNLDELRKNTIENGVKVLNEYGLGAEYNRELNQFYVKDLEKINELTATSKGKYNSLQEATNALREDTENLVETLTDLNDENRDGAESITELGHSVDDAKVDIVNALKEIVVQASEALDVVQDVYTTLQDAANEYAANDGFISVDTFQAIVELGPQYMQYLRDENGLLVINKENIEAVIRAKTEQLALENALSYVYRIREAMEDDSVENLEAIISATEDAIDTTWDFVYAELAALGLTNDQYDAALHNINAMRTLAESAKSGIGKVTDELTDGLEAMKTGTDDILKYVMDMLKHQVDEQIESIEKMKDAWKDAINEKKDALDTAKKEADYQEKIADKIAEIADIQARIDKLALDNSRSAKAQEAALREELAEKQKELADEQEEYAIEKQKESYDKTLEFYEEEKDKEIEVLEDSISSEQKLYDKAIEYIEENWDSLYDELIDWNYEYGSVLEDEITSAWENCLAAAKKYGSYTSALKGIAADEEGLESGSSGTVAEDSDGIMDAGRMNNMQRASKIVEKMVEIGSGWGSATSVEEQNELHKKVTAEAAKLTNCGIVARFDPASGVWYIDSDSNAPENAGKKLIDTYLGVYHSGGIAGNTGTLKENETLAILQKGEPIISNSDKDALFDLIEFTTLLTEKMGEFNGFNGIDLLQNRNVSANDLFSPASNNTTIEFGDVYIYGASDDTVKKHREVNRQLVNEVLHTLDIKH